MLSYFVKHIRHNMLIPSLLIIFLLLVGCVRNPVNSDFPSSNPSNIILTQETVPVESDTDKTSESVSQDAVSPITASDETYSPESSMEVHYIDVGQGDCTLIVCGEEAMLIDAGDDSKGTTVQLYLQKQDINQLKYVIGTHPDADHIGGLDVILYKFDCETIIMPDVSSDTKAYRDVKDTLAHKGYEITFPNVGDQYALGDAAFTIIGPGKAYADDNNNSVALKLTHGNNSFLFTGDAEEEAEKDYLQAGMLLHADVLKAGHHGSSSAACEDFLKAVNPEVAVISCGIDNTYGHPHRELLMRFKDMGVPVYRTDEQGNIVITSDGRSLEYSCNASETWQSGDAKAALKKEPEQTKYILNLNTKKFHYPWCSSVDEMKEKNKQESTESRESIIAKGYQPCKRCNP